LVLQLQLELLQYQVAVKTDRMTAELQTVEELCQNG
jgi:hypothetical protein